jgi:hypothetical protein
MIQNADLTIIALSFPREPFCLTIQSVERAHERCNHAMNLLQELVQV